MIVVNDVLVSILVVIVTSRENMEDFADVYATDLIHLWSSSLVIWHTTRNTRSDALQILAVKKIVFIKVSLRQLAFIVKAGTSHLHDNLSVN